MKLLELHIRNIASIEKADIDFVNQPGLIDPDTNQPAQTFLIYGDTGTGKSVLLDSITLALFKKTPRTENVEDRTKNSFTTASGEVNITSIEQYTRLGISERDECYSEVVFTGNDGVVSRARLELGYSKSRTGQLKHRTEWKLKHGDKDWEKCDSKGEAIEALIGISFTQFNRMAMLAQGQFASFLCGSRDERSAILEKLTNTEIFSRYGEAIASLHSRFNKETSIAKTAYETDLGHMPEPEELEKLQKQKEDADLTILNLNKEIPAVTIRLSLLNSIDEATQKLLEAQNRLNELNDVVAGAEYQGKKQRCTIWDSTDSQRKYLSIKLENEAELKKKEEETTLLRARFDKASAWLSRHENSLADRQNRLSDLRAWLDKRQQREQLYTNAQLSCLQIAQYIKSLQERARHSEEKQAADNQVDALNKTLSDKKNDETKVREAVTGCQNQITKLTELRDSLNLQEVARQQESNAKATNLLDKLGGDYTRLCEQKKEHEKKQQELEKNSKAYNLKLQENKTYEEQYNRDKKAYDTAVDNFNIQQASLDESLQTLRQKLLTSDIDICPLCRQKIDKSILSTDSLQEILTPYEDRKFEAQQKMDLSLNSYSAALGETNRLAGIIETEKKTLTGLETAIAGMAAQLNNQLALLQIDTEGDILLQLEEQKKVLEEQNKTLKEKTDKGIEYQKQIDLLMQGKKKIDDTLSTALEERQKAQTAVDTNNTNRQQLATQLEKDTNDLCEKKRNLDKILFPWRPDWEQHLGDIASQLEQEATEYNTRKQQHNTDSTQLENDRQQSVLMHKIQAGISGRHPQWNTPSNTADLPDKELTLSDWHTLDTDSSTLISSINKLKQTISICQSELDNWQQQTGMTEQDLLLIMRQKEAIEPARSYLNNIDNTIKTNKEKITESTQAIHEAREKLQLAETEPLPDSTLLQQQLNEMTLQEQDARDKRTAAVTKLDEARRNREKSEVSLQLYTQAKERSDHWDELNRIFGKDRFRNIVQTHILRPLLDNANQYLSRITDRYLLTCSEENEKLSILVQDRFNRNEIRSATVLSGGEKFMISLALSLALSSLNRPDLNVDILFIDEGFGTLDQECLDSVMKTLGRLGEISGNSRRRVGIISHREELLGRIPNKIKLLRNGESRSHVEVVYEN